MREERPVHYDEQRETWDVFRYDDVDRILKDHGSIFKHGRDYRSYFSSSA
ncbi:hypothetical protein [Halostagnicola kamekurae]|nr:hypothetical protein [Halostagnicola kamekurae]